MNDYGITKKNLLRRFSSAMAGTENLAALADGAAEMLARRPAEIRKLLLYTNVDEMDEELLDILAKDFNVYWWDADASLAQKRRMIQSAPAVSRITGTTAATKRQAEAFYPGTTLEEWFTYGGSPGYFRLYINITDSADEPVPMYSAADAERKLLSSKRWSAHMESFSYMVRHALLLGAKVTRWACRPPICGTIFCGTWWEPSTLGHSERAAIINGAAPDAFAASPDFAGTLPVPSAVGYTVCGGVLSGGITAALVATSEPAGQQQLCGTLPEA